MRTRTPALAALASSLLLGVATGSAGAQPAPDHGSCAAFGANVAGLAQALGGDFGATASSVARSGPAAFPNVVVYPEQAAFCAPR